MVLNLGNKGLLGNYTEDYSDEFFSSETESGWGIIGHWWQDITPWDDFVGADGSAVDATKWTTSVTSSGTVTISSNKAQLNCPSTSDTATMVSTNYLNCNKFFIRIEKADLATRSADNHCYIYVGNDTDGWSEVFDYSPSAGTTTTTVVSGFPISIEGFYKGNDYWDIYCDAILVGSNILLPNKLSVKFYVITGTQTSSTAVMRIQSIYLSN